MTSRSHCVDTRMRYKLLRRKEIITLWYLFVARCKIALHILARA